MFFKTIILVDATVEILIFAVLAIQGVIDIMPPIVTKRTRIGATAVL